MGNNSDKRRLCDFVDHILLTVRVIACKTDEQTDHVPMHCPFPGLARFRFESVVPLWERVGRTAGLYPRSTVAFQP